MYTIKLLVSREVDPNTLSISDKECPISTNIYAKLSLVIP